MSKILLVVITFLSLNTFGARINLPENTQAYKVISHQDFVKNEIDAINSLSDSKVELIVITSKDVGIREDLGLSEQYNSGNKHKFIFENEDGSLSCSFSIYVIYQHTAPISINKKYSQVTRSAECTEI